MAVQTNNNLACALRILANQVENLDRFEEIDGVIRVNTIEEWLDLFLMGYQTTNDVAMCFGKEIKFSGSVGKIVELILELLSVAKPQTNVKATV
jgi:hypothetical protein